MKKLIQIFTVPSLSLFFFLFSGILTPIASSAGNIASPFADRIWMQHKIYGRVTGSNGEPLEGVSVLVKATSRGTVTDASGTYAISAASGTTLVFSFSGYVTQEIVVGSQAEVNVSLKETTSKLDEVVVIGYGKQSRDRITTAVSKLDTNVLRNIPYSNVASALQGTIPGLRVQTTSGQPGETPRVILRGGTSIDNPNGATPLYIIDGVIRTSLNNVAPQDIESVQVLKDAASTAIYGARGSNGVIIVTTKSGKPGHTKISFSSNLMLSARGRTIEYASAKDYIYYSRLSMVASAIKNPSLLARNDLPTGSGIGNDLTSSTGFTTQYLTPDNEYKLNDGWQSMPDPLDPAKTIIFKETNYQDLIYRTGISQNHYLSASGGTQKSTFNIGVGYLENKGAVKATNYNRLSMNMNGTVKILDNLDVTGRLGYSNTKSKAVSSEATIFRNSASLPGTAKYRFEDGSLAPGLSSGVGNPDYFLTGPAAAQGDNDYDNLSLSLTAHWRILPGLSFDPQVSMYKVKTDNFSFRPSYLNGVNNLVLTRDASAASSRVTQYQADAVLTYVKSFNGSHNIEVKGGYSYFSRLNFSISANGQGAATDLIPTLNAAALPTNVGGSESSNAIQGLFSRINYDFRGKYLLSLNTRYDGASNLGEDHKYGFFPGVSAGWNIHKENFWHDAMPKLMSSLKLRGSYGENGNISGLGDFQAQGAYGVNDRYLGVAAVQPSVIPNPDLQWEESRTFDGGLDLGLLNDRISVIFDYYNRITDHLLTEVRLPGSTGFSTVLTNYGSLQNRGVEMEVSARIFKTNSGFQWNVSFNAAKTKTKILKLPDNGIAKNRIGGENVWDPVSKSYVWLGGLQEGGRIGDMFAYQQIGVYATDADAAKAPQDMSVPIDKANSANGRNKFGGDVIWADRDGNNIIDGFDRVYVGNPYPVWTGGFSNIFSYKSLSLYVRMDFMTGHTIYNGVRSFADGQSQGDALPTKEYLENMWKKQGDVTNTPRYLWQNQQSNISRSSVYYEPGNFLALREITLGYTLPQHLLQRLRLDDLRFNLTGNNLHYFTKYKGISPEDGGTDNGSYPIPRNFILGVNLSF